MKPRLLYCLNIIFIFCIGNTFSQEQTAIPAPVLEDEARDLVELGVGYMLTNEDFVPTNGQSDLLLHTGHHSFGFYIMNTFRSNIYFKIGINFRRFGTRLRVEETTFRNPEGTGNYYHIQWNANTVEFPADIGYYFIENSKYRLGGGIGINYSTLLNQEEKIKKFSADTDIYDKHFLTISTNISFSLKLGKRWLFNVLPFWERQIKPIFLDQKRRSLGCEFGISFR